MLPHPEVERAGVAMVAPVATEDGAVTEVAESQAVTRAVPVAVVEPVVATCQRSLPLRG